MKTPESRMTPHPEQAQVRAQARLLESFERLTGSEALPFDGDRQATQYRTHMERWIKAGVSPGAIAFAEGEALDKAESPLPYFTTIMNRGLRAMWGTWSDEALEEQSNDRTRPDSKFAHLFNRDNSGMWEENA